VEDEEPDIERRDRQQHRHEHERRVQPSQEPRGAVGRLLRQHRPPVPEREQRHALLQPRRAAVGVREHAQRPQLLVDQELDVVAGDAAAVLLAHEVGDRVDVAPSVARLGHEVEQLRELDDLPVRAACEVRGDLEARALELADQLDPVSALHGDGFRRAHRRH
jgi:hypothetical protein